MWLGLSEDILQLLRKCQVYLVELGDLFSDHVENLSLAEPMMICSPSFTNLVFRHEYVSDCKSILHSCSFSDMPIAACRF